MLEKSDEGKKFLDEYSKNPQELITDAQRCLIVQICLTNLIDQTGVYYPSAATKERLAKEIVDTFPSLKSNCQVYQNTPTSTTTSLTVTSRHFLKKEEVMLVSQRENGSRRLRKLWRPQ